MLPPEYGGRFAVSKYGEASVSHDATHLVSDPPATLSPQEAWRSLAPLLAARPRMRPSRRRRQGVEYPGQLERPMDAATCPSQPTAVHVYDERGYTRMLPFDLDAHERTPAQAEAVDRDLDQLQGILDAVGAAYLADRAHAGAHVYVLLEEPLSADDARTLALAMCRRLPTLDPGPMRSATDGLITVPGTAHRLGGHRELISSDAETRNIVDGARTPRSSVMRLRMMLADELRAIAAEDRARGDASRARRRVAGAADTVHIDALEDLTITQRGVGRHMSSKLADIARHGDWRSYDYPSASEARAAVLMSALATGLTQSDVQARMLDGRWAGLRSLFDHKGLHRLSSEISSAEAEIRRREGTKHLARGKSADTSDTSAITHSGGGVREASASVSDTHGVIRSWRTVLHSQGSLEFPGSTGWKVLLVLRALASNAHMVGDQRTCTGVRWIAVATGLGVDTVATVLRELAAQSDPWIVLVKRGTGVLANEYELRIPDRHQASAERARWVSGKAHSLRPVFTVLGTPSALVYEAIEQGRGGSYAQLILRTGLCRDSVREAIGILEGWGLITGDASEGWGLSSNDADLERLAERLGATAARARKLARFREQRRKYLEFLETASRQRTWIRFVRSVDDEPPPEVREVLDLLHAEAG